MDNAPTVLQTDVHLLLTCVRRRYLAGDHTAIILALEGLKWLAGDESQMTRERLQREEEVGP